jgi:hypothetical protein
MIGLFIAFASTAEQAQTEAEVLLVDTSVRNVMTSHPITAPGDITVQELLDTIRSCRCSRGSSAHATIERWSSTRATSSGSCRRPTSSGRSMRRTPERGDPP